MNEAHDIDRQAIIGTIIHLFDIRGKTAHAALIMAGELDLPPAGYRRSFAVGQFAEALRYQLALADWQAKGLATYLTTYDRAAGVDPLAVAKILKAATSAARREAPNAGNPVEGQNENHK